MGPAGDQIYRDLGRILSDRAKEIDWAAYDAAKWNRLAEAAEEEGVAPLVGWKMTHDGQGWPADIPVDVRRSLNRSYYNTAAHNAMLYQELVRILNSLAEDEISTVVLKGAAFAATLYPDPALRPMRDLDLLVPREDLPTALERMESLGFVGTQELAPRHNHSLRHHASFYKNENRQIAVEIHWTLVTSLLDGRSPSTDWIWEQVRPKQEVNVVLFAEEEPLEIQVLSPESTLLYLASHALIQHNIASSPLIWFYDVDQLIRHHGSDLDWEALLAQAEEIGWLEALLAALLVAEELFGTEVPAGVHAKLEGRHRQEVARLLDASIPVARTNTAIFWSRWKNLNWRGRSALILAFLFPAPAFVRHRYQPKPRWTWPLYYVYRWLAALHDAARTVLQRRAESTLRT
jgi:hypothetical protein